MATEIVTSRYRLILGDNLPILAGMQDNEFDAALNDPPYGIKENHKKVKSRGSQKGKPSRKNPSMKSLGAGVAATDYGEFSWDNEPAKPETLLHIRRVARKQVIWGGNYFHLPPSPSWFIWDKVNGNSDFADCEMAWTNLETAVRMFRHQWNGMLRETEKEKRIHPAQKPVALYRWVIGKLKLKPNSNIIDAYMGSASAGIASIQAGHFYTGIESFEPYFEKAAERMEDAARQLDREFKVTKRGRIDEFENLPLFQHREPDNDDDGLDEFDDEEPFEIDEEAEFDELLEFA